MIFRRRFKIPVNVKSILKDKKTLAYIIASTPLVLAVVAQIFKVHDVKRSWLVGFGVGLSVVAQTLGLHVDKSTTAKLMSIVISIGLTGVVLELLDSFIMNTDINLQQDPTVIKYFGAGILLGAIAGFVVATVTGSAKREFKEVYQKTIEALTKKGFTIAALVVIYILLGMFFAFQVLHSIYDLMTNKMYSELKHDTWEIDKTKQQLRKIKRLSLKLKVENLTKKLAKNPKNFETIILSLFYSEMSPKYRRLFRITPANPIQESQLIDNPEIKKWLKEPLSVHNYDKLVIQCRECLEFAIKLMNEFGYKLKGCIYFMMDKTFTIANFRNIVFCDQYLLKLFDKGMQKRFSMPLRRGHLVAIFLHELRHSIQFSKEDRFTLFTRGILPYAIAVIFLFTAGLKYVAEETSTLWLLAGVGIAIITSTVLLSQAIVAAAGKVFEYDADTFAASLGFGEELAQVTEVFTMFRQDILSYISQMMFDEHPLDFNRVANARKVKEIVDKYLEAYREVKQKV